MKERISGKKGNKDTTKKIYKLRMKKATKMEKI
jgi:hypothetical protein